MHLLPSAPGMSPQPSASIEVWDLFSPAPAPTLGSVLLAFTLAFSAVMCKRHPR